MRNCGVAASSRSSRRRQNDEPLPPAALVLDRAEVLVDAEDDQDQFRGDAREHDADDDAGDRRQHHQEAAERADRHRGEAGEDAGESEQARSRAITSQ